MPCAGRLLRKQFKAPSVWEEPTQLAVNCRMPVYLWFISQHWIAQGRALFSSKPECLDRKYFIDRKVPTFWNVKRPKNVTFSVLWTALLLSGARADNQNVYVEPYLWLQWNVLQSKSQNLEICSWWKQDIYSQIQIKVTDVNKKKVLITSNLFCQARDPLSGCDLTASHNWNRDFIWLLLAWEI